MPKLEWDKVWRLVETDYKTPYADWDGFTGGSHAAIRNNDDGVVRLKPEPVLFGRSEPKDFDAARSQTSIIIAEALERILARNALPPLPKEAFIEPEFHHNHRSEYGDFPQVFADADADPGKLPDALKVDRETRLIGVIDLGIPLGHRWTRKDDGTTRILAAWQQAADRSDLKEAVFEPETPPEVEGRARQNYLPFGRELLAHEINELILKHTPSRDMRAGYLDEEAYNRNTWTEDFKNIFGNRELGRHASHGAHTLHLAGGAEPSSEFADATRFLLVNFPERSLVGHSAVFLEYFALLAIWRIIALADKLWTLNFGNTAAKRDNSENEGFELVINLSFGKQASSRDGHDHIARTIRKINKSRENLGLRAVYLTIPAGNENLEQGNARVRLNAGATETFEWRIQPDDQSANFLEIWAPWRTPDLGDLMPLQIEVVSPDGVTSNLTAPEFDRANPFSWRSVDLVARMPGAGESAASDVVARIYAQVFEDEERRNVETEDRAERRPRKRMRYVVAIKQTQLFESGQAVAPAGPWRVRVRNTTSEPLAVSANVQTDQTAQPVTAVNKRSYLERPEYRRFDETGRRVDSYGYSLEPTDLPVNQDNSNVVRRHGTINAIGISRYTATIAAHRATDGRPATYSGTGIIRSRRVEGGDVPDRESPFRAGSVQPTASLPGSEGAAHFGILSSGARDGSAAAFAGTSFPSAMAARVLVTHRVAGGFPDPDPFIREFEQLAETMETETHFPGQASPLKIGKGRVPNPVRPDSDRAEAQLGRFFRRGKF